MLNPNQQLIKTNILKSIKNKYFKLIKRENEWSSMKKKRKKREKIDGT